MSKEVELSRRGFLDATAKACGFALLGGAGLVPTSKGAEAGASALESQVESPRTPKGTWPQEYTVQRDETAGHLVLSTPYYSVTHDLKHGGAIVQIRYRHGAVSSLLLEPMGASVELAAKKLPQHITKQEEGPPLIALSDLYDSSPSVSVAKSGRGPTVTVQAALRAPQTDELGLQTRTTYEYRWGFIKIHKEFVFPAEGVRTAGLTVLATCTMAYALHNGFQ